MIVISRLLGSLSAGENQAISAWTECRSTAIRCISHHNGVMDIYGYSKTKGGFTAFPYDPLTIQQPHGIKIPKVDYRVEKALKFYQNASALQQARGEMQHGNLGLGERLILRQADQMLLYAIRFEDADYLQEAEALYKLNGLYRNTFDP